MIELENLHFYSPYEIIDPDKDCQWLLKPLYKVFLGKSILMLTDWKRDDTADHLLIVKGKT